MRSEHREKQGEMEEGEMAKALIEANDRAGEGDREPGRGQRRGVQGKKKQNISVCVRDMKRWAGGLLHHVC